MLISVCLASCLRRQIVMIVLYASRGKGVMTYPVIFYFPPSFTNEGWYLEFKKGISGKWGKQSNTKPSSWSTGWTNRKQWWEGHLTVFYEDDEDDFFVFVTHNSHIYFWHEWRYIWNNCLMCWMHAIRFCKLLWIIGQLYLMKCIPDIQLLITRSYSQIASLKCPIRINSLRKTLCNLP